MRLLIALSILLSLNALAEDCAPRQISTTEKPCRDVGWILLSWSPPTEDLKGDPLPASRLLRYDLSLNGQPLGKAGPADKSYTHRVPDGKCVRISDEFTVTALDVTGLSAAASKPAKLDHDVCTPSLTIPAGPPQNFRVAILAQSGDLINGRIECDLPPKTESVRLFAVVDGKLGNRLATYKTCGGTYPKFVKGRSYVLKLVDSKGKLSGWSNVVII